MSLPRNKKELTEAVYRTLPTSLVQPCVVRSKVETKPHNLNLILYFSRLKILTFCWRDNNCSRPRAFMSFLR